MQEIIEVLKLEIIRSLKDHGEKPLQSLIDNIWRDDNLIIDFEESPEKIITEAVTILEAEGFVTRIGDIDDTVQLNYDMLIEDESEDVYVTSPWKLRVSGQILIANLKNLEKNQISKIFNDLREKGIISKKFHERENHENHYEIIWNDHGFQSNAIIFPSSDFIIEVYFKGNEHPELIRPPELEDDDSKKLIHSVLGTGFFELFVILKKIVTTLFEYS